MSRDDGFEIADVDVKLLDDPKVRALVRACSGNEYLLNRCVVAYVALVLASWRDGVRATLESAAPLWLDADQLAEVGDRLRHAKMLDGNRLPKRSWDSWFGPAQARREQRREASAVANAARWGNGSRAVSGRDSGRTPDALPVRTVRTDRSVRRAPARESGDPRSLKEILRGTTGEPKIVGGGG